MDKKPDPLDLLRRSAAKINVLKAELDKTKEPIAIVGMSCRFPGAPNLDAYWKLLDGGVDAISEVPPDRWDIDAYYDPDPDVAGKMSTRYGGFIGDVDQFDPGFFAISPKEAMELDPQQRLLLEVSWQALEHAGIAPTSLAGSRGGVYFGVSSFDYQQVLSRGGEAAIGPYAGTGIAHSAAVGRVSFFLGMEGPSLAVDTACSSSLVALNQACQGLRAGDCDLALAGGVNAILTPWPTIYFSRGRFMAPDGRCKTFDARGDGYVRGEGCGVVVLKRLSDAVGDGDRILAVVRGSAVNQDGASSGLTVPNGPAQEKVIGQALARAGVKPEEIAYVEAHGTGTPLGDPIEAQALHNALGKAQARSGPLLVGSVKTNIGHLEAAAGVASVIKVVLAISRGAIPRQLHFETPSPKIAWDEVNVEVVSEARAWPEGRRLAGVSSFAFQGTNAHVILEGIAETEALSVPAALPKELGEVVPADGLLERRYRVLPLSGKGEEALGDLAETYAAWLRDHRDLEAADLAFSAGAGRSHFETRAGLVIRDGEDLRTKLAALAAGESAEEVSLGTADRAPRLAFLFTGQGSQYLGMGKALYEREAVVRAVLDRCDGVIEEIRGQSLLDVMFGESDASLDDTAWTQPALYALEVALVELYRSAGITPAVVLGHSVGEYAAAYAAGVFGLEEGLRLIAARGALMAALPSGGSMAAVFAETQRVETALADAKGKIEIASDNGGHQVVSGPTDAIEALVATLTEAGIRCERLNTSHAFHSALLDPMLAGLEAAAKEVSAKRPRRSMISNVTGQLVGSDMPLDAAYWRRHAREPVRFAEGVAALAEIGVDLVLEVGPHPVLAGMLSLCWPEGTQAPGGVASLRRGTDADLQLATALATLYAKGATLSFEALFAGEKRRKLALPSYPFQRRRYWAETTALLQTAGRAAEHPLLGARTASARGDAIFEASLSSDAPGWLADHRVFDHAILPAAAYLEMGLAAVALCDPAGSQASLSSLQIEAPLALDRPTRIQTLVSAEGQLEIFAEVEGSAVEPGSKARWLRHAVASTEAEADGVAAVDLAALSDRCPEERDPERIYADYEAMGLPYGPAFRALVSLRSGRDECLAELVLPDAAESEGRYFVPPSLLDGAFHALGVLWPDSEAGELSLPVSVEKVGCHGSLRAWTAGSRLFAHLRVSTLSSDDRTAAVTLFDEAGAVLLSLEGLAVRPAERSSFESLIAGRAPSLLYELAWRAVTSEGATAEEIANFEAPLLLLAGDASGDALVDALSQGLSERGVPSIAGPPAWDLLAGERIRNAPADAAAGVVWISPSLDDESEEPLGAAQEPIARLLELLQELSAAERALPLGVTLVTRWAVATAPGERVNPLGSSVWGLARSVQSELPNLGLRLVDLEREAAGPTIGPAQSADLLDLLLTPAAESQMALRNAQRLAPRLLRASADLRMPSAGGRLEIAKRGSFDGLQIARLREQAPGPGEVTLAVRAAGLNFRDVLNALGAYPGDAGGLGGEAAGVVVAVGAGVEHLSVGERAFGIVDGGFASQVTTDAQVLQRMPAKLDFTGAASLPVAFCTALAAFDLAGLRQGQSVLIHAGAGGVGQAAIQVALGLGATVYTTASEPKQAFLRGLGVEAVFDSRSTDFGAALLEATAGAGVDVVLNSLTSEGFIEASLSCLKRGGHFVEIGKRNIWREEDMAAARPDVGYSILALDDWTRNEPQRVARLLDRLAGEVERGALKALPCRSFPLSAAPSAMRLMQQARHIGKIVLTVEPSRVRGDRGYLITGGLGAVGLETAAWLAQAGAGLLVLAGRRAPSEAAEARLAAIAGESGCRIETVPLDSSEQEAVAALVGRFGTEASGWPPLGGVVHAAGVLDDALLSEQSWDRFEPVLRPKVSGGWNLHRATRGLDLDLFLLYSSAAATLGSPGQSNYAAANAFLDGLALLRRSQGLAATSIAWGPWSVGMAEDATVKANLARQGLRTLSPEDAHRSLAQLLSLGQTTGLVLDVEWSRMSKALGRTRPAMLADLLGKAASRAESALLQRLKATPAGQREAALLSFLQGELRAVLGLADPPAPAAGFFDLGMDSLMAVELRNRLNAALEDAYQVPNTVAFDHPSLEKLARHLTLQLGDLGEKRPARLVASAQPKVVDAEPIAIVGMACRFPGAPDLESYWNLLSAGVDAISEVPPDRWDIDRYYDPDPDVPGKMLTRYGGFIEAIDLFDPQFFAISPKEAIELDPQQRLLLEMSWRALEHAGISAASLAGSSTGVYAGISSSDYHQLLGRGGEAAIGPYMGTGIAHSAAVGRISFVLDLEGPSLAVDTACSASLVALYQACQGLRGGDCDLALAGGVNAILTPDATIYFSRGRFMAPDGRCKTFDARGDGYVRGEGCGVVVLKRLSDARRDGDRVLAVVRGGAVNQDGASSGLTVPNGPAQERVIGSALARAEVSPAEVAYVEAHGTGTPLGDPIEVQALHNALGRERSEAGPLLTGSVKTNIGHLEAAAGIASVIKVVLAMTRDEIPGQLHFETPSPKIAWDAVNVEVVSKARAWPAGRRVAGVSGFAFQGTNAHVILEAVDDAVEEGRPSGTWSAQEIRVSLPEPLPAVAPTDAIAPAAKGARLLPLSGKTDAAVRDLAQAHLEWIAAQDEPDLDDLAYAAGVTRSHFRDRAGIVFSGIDDLKAKLAAVRSGATADGLSRGNADAPPKVAFLFTGQGSQRVGMGRALYDREPLVRALLDRCDAIAREVRGESLLERMIGGEQAALDDTAWAQPALYALEVALVEFYRSAGIEPAVVMGHSVGEFAAAYTAGILTLEEGLRLILARGALMGDLPAGGAMAAVFAPAERVAAAIDEVNAGLAEGAAGLSLAADNGKHQVISGPAELIERASQAFAADGLRCEVLRTSHAFHSALLEPMLADLEAAASDFAARPPHCTLISNLTGEALAADEVLDGAYWRSHARSPVQFAKSVASLAKTSVDIVVELGPHPVLGPMLSMAWTGAGDPPATLCSLRRDGDDREQLLTVLAGLYAAGAKLSFEALFNGETRRKVPLPGYPFQRQRYWAETRRLSPGRAGERQHPLLGVERRSPKGGISYDSLLSLQDLPWLSDHPVFGQVVVPGAYFLAMAATASAKGMEPRSIQLESLQLFSPLLLSEDREPCSLELVLEQPREGEGPRTVEIFSRSDDEEGWTLHARAMIAPVETTDAPTVDLSGLQRRLAEEDVAEMYGAFARLGIAYGPSFQTVRSLWSGDGEALGEVVLAEGLKRQGLDAHPSLLDGCLQVMSAALPEDRRTSLYLPIAWRRVRLDGSLPDRVFSHVVLHDADALSEGPAETLIADITLYDEAGRSLGELERFTCKRATRRALLPRQESIEDWIYGVAWRKRPLADPVPPANFPATPSEIAERLREPAAALMGAEGVTTAQFDALSNDLEHVARIFALRALQGLGWRPKAGARVSAEDLGRGLGIKVGYERLLGRILVILGDAGLLRPVTRETGPSRKWEVVSDRLPKALQDDPASLKADLLCRHPYGFVELELLYRCGESLADVLRDREDPIQLLFSEKGVSAGNLYRDAAATRIYNRLAALAVKEAIRDLPPGRRLKMLEVGAGTGGTTTSVLPELPAGWTDYTYTDISSAFFSAAKARFEAAYPFLDFRVLDVEQDPGAQDFPAGGYDVIMASNVLHATEDLAVTLKHCRALLAPGGLLLLFEVLKPQGWLDLTFGLTEGWWRFQDAYRPDYALMSGSRWQEVLSDNGYVEAGVLTAAPPGDEAAGTPSAATQGVIVARRPVEEATGQWLLAGGKGRFAEQLADLLLTRGQRVVLAGAQGRSRKKAAPAEPENLVRAYVDPQRREAWSSLLAELPRTMPLRGVVHLAEFDEETPEDLAAALRHAAGSALALSQALLEAGPDGCEGLTVATRGAQVLEREAAGSLAGTALWGFARTLAREAPDLPVRMIDLGGTGEGDAESLLEELLSPDRETQVARRGEERYTARLIRGRDLWAKLEPGVDSAWRLLPSPDGRLERLSGAAFDPPALRSGEVRIAVEAAGLNFRDVLVSIGLYPEPNQDLGGELCGRVVELASDVEDLSLGQRVVGFGNRCFATQAVARAELLVPAPEGRSSAALATLPIVSVTALLAFELATLKRGERVLIHGGAGGVGLAAIRLAQSQGAEVVATASAAKQDFLRALGVAEVYDSRSTDFSERILAASGGRGVDLVLNSLTGEGFVEASLACLAKGGRFVEIAKRNIWTAEEMTAARPDVTYHILAVDHLLGSDPTFVGAALKRVMEHLRQGSLACLPHVTWPLSEAPEAMAYMRAARHVGKIVLTVPDFDRGELKGDRSYLVTGGLGAIGLGLAAWLADRGARHIVLNARRGPGADAAAAISALEERGVQVRVILADVGEPEEVAALLAEIDRELPPLAGLFHCVGVLSDAAIGNQSWESFEAVLKPKVLGAWALHRQTLDRELDLFVLFSSIAGVLGNPGQSNYAAANACLDQLARLRQSQGLPGQSIAWGAWSGAGMAEEQRDRMGAQMRAAGVDWIDPEQGFGALDRLLRLGATESVVVPIDWDVQAAAQERPPVFVEELVSGAAAGAGEHTAVGQLARRVQEADAETRRALLESWLGEQVQAALRLAEPPGATIGFFDLGMDSLSAIELSRQVEMGLDVKLETSVLFDYPTLARLAAHLAGALPDAPVSRARPTASALERVAIVGLACRFPGGGDAEAFWSLLSEGRSGIAEVPRDRWDMDRYFDPQPGKPGKSVTRRGGFIEDIDLFDPAFFRISPAEAEFLDPQHRLLLELSWQALEHAGIDPESLQGSRTGVFAGISTQDYREIVGKQSRDATALYAATGTTSSTAIGRISFVLGLQGPAVAVDTACSASLVALDQACDALRGGKADLALAGGVNAMLTPAGFLAFSGGGMLSPDGLCKTFDASADGYVRGEGCGMLVLKRLSDAERDGDRILAVVRGSAVNQDGASAGLTVPNGPAQERVLAEALERAGLEPSEVDYLEAHGTGTELGDPIEVRAAAAVYGRGRDPSHPLLVGSVKTNIGHLEAAAGVAGVIKTVLAMQRGRIPKHLNFSTPSPRIDWTGVPVRVTVEEMAWPGPDDRPPRAAVSSFGFSGTNAHVVLEGYAGESTRTVPRVWPETLPRDEGEASAEERRHRLLPLSGKSEAALRALAGAYAGWLSAGPDIDLGDLAYSAAVGRSHFAQRAGVVFEGADELRAKLAALVAGEARDGVSLGSAAAPKIAFLFTGQGSQVPGMGRGLYRREPVVRAVLDRCEAVVRELRGSSLLEVMFGQSEEALSDTAWTQPALYALEVALLELYRSLGVEPAVVLGHSVGEYAAAYAAGVFGLEEGLRLIAKRGALMSALPPGGSMVAVFAGAERVAATIEAVNGEVGEDQAGLSLAADNGLHQVVSGPADLVDALIERFSGAGLRCQLLKTSHAFHSALLEPMLGDLEAAAAEVSAKPPQATLISNLTGRAVESGKGLDGAYWREHARQPVQFAASIQSLAEQGVDLVVELGPHLTLAPMVALGWPEQGAAPQPVTVASLMRERDEGAQFMTALAVLYAGGARVRLEALYGGETRRKITLPSYPFQRQRYWVGDGEEGNAALLDSKIIRKLIEEDETRLLAELGLDDGEGSARQLLRSLRRRYAAEQETGGIDELLYAMAWRQGAPLPVQVQPPAGGTWLLLSDDEAAAVALKEALAAHGAASLVSSLSQGLSDLDGLLVETTDEAGVAGIVVLWGRGDDASPERVEAVRQVLALAQDLLRRGLEVPLSLVTAAAHQVAVDDDTVAPDQTALWGFGRVLVVEHPELLGKLIDLPAGAVGDLAEPLALELLAAGDEDQIALRGEGRYLARLEPLSPRDFAETLPLHEDASTLVTGGLGSMGLALAEWLARQGARHLVLVGRRAPSDEARDKIAAIAKATDCVIDTASVDVAEGDQVHALVARFGTGGDGWPRLGGVIHAAGVGGLDSIEELNEDLFDRIARGKLEGAWNLHRATRKIAGLDFFFCISSISSVWGGMGQGHYASANAFIDGLVAFRRSLGLPATSVNLGLWADSGMAGDSEIQAWLTRVGIPPMSPGECLAGYGALLRQDIGQAILARVDWETFARVMELRRPRPFLESVRQGGEDRDQAALLYEVSWRDVAVDGAGKSEEEPGTLLLVAREPGAQRLQELLRRGLEEQGAKVATESDVRQLRREILQKGDIRGSSVDGVVVIQPDPAEDDAVDPMERAKAALAGLLGLVQALVEEGLSLPLGLSVVTRSAVAPEDRSPVDPIASSLWGFARSVQSEQPGLKLRLVDVADDDEETALSAGLAQVVLSGGAEAQLALRGRRVLAPRLGALDLPSDAALTLRSDRSYLITGGLGALGLETASWLVAGGARHVVLAGRQEPSEDLADRVAALCGADGCSVVAVQLDARDAEAVAALVARFDDETSGWPSLGGVVHAAGDLDDGVLLDQNWSRFEGVLAPKLAGAWHLHRATQDLKLDFFLLYSSAAATLGYNAQTNSAAANAYLDGLAALRRNQGLAGLSIAWGPWTIGRGAEDVVQGNLERLGLRPLPPADALQALSRLLASGRAAAVVLDADWSRVGQSLGAFLPPLLSDLHSKAGQADAGSLATRLREASESERQAMLIDYLQGEVQAVLGLDTPPAPSDWLFDLGMDSLMAVQLVEKIARETGEDLPAKVFYEIPTVAAISDLLNSRMELPYEPLVTFGEAANDGRPVLFCIHPDFGHASEFERLAAPLGDLVRVVGLQCRGLTPGQTRFKGLEDMVVTYLDRVGEVAPEGPILLLGWSIGGVVAQEMAVRLSTLGRDVRLLTLLDALAPGEAHYPVMMLEEWLRHVLAELAGLPREEIEGLSGDEMMARATDLFARLDVLDLNGREEEASDRDRVEAAVRLAYHTRALIAVARPPLAFEGAAWLLRARDTAAQESDPAFGWSDLCPDLELSDSTFESLALLRGESAVAVARGLRERLLRALAEEEDDGDPAGPRQRQPEKTA